MGTSRPNPDIEKGLTSIYEDLKTVFERKALIRLNRLLIHTRLDQKPMSFYQGSDDSLGISLSSVFVSFFIRLDINSIQRTSV